MFSIFFIHILISFTVNVRAVTYTLDVDEDDTFEWKITEINPHEFEKIFGYEPQLEKGDKAKRTINRVDDTNDGWELTVELWDFKVNKDDDNGTITYLTVPDSPGDYDENLFIPTPVNDFLSEAAEDLPSEYIVEGMKVTRRETDYIVEKEYDSRGVLLSETYINDNEITLIKVEGTFRIIPAANIELLLGLIAFAIGAIIFIKIKTKKILITNN